MNFVLNQLNGSWLSQLNGKTIEKIYQIDFNKDRHNDSYLPWLFYLTFSDFNLNLEIEGDFDGDHINANLMDNATLDEKLSENNFPNEPDMWQVYETETNEVLGRLLGQKIDFIEFGIDKEAFEINGTKMKGQKEYFSFIRFNSENLSITIFEGSATGLDVSDKTEQKMKFGHTFDVFTTKQ